MNSPVLSHVWTRIATIAIGTVLTLQRQKKMPVMWIASHATMIAADSDTPIRIWRFIASDGWAAVMLTRAGLPD